MAESACNGTPCVCGKHGIGRQWLPMKTAPKDGTIVRLLVDYSGDDACHPLEDATVTHTIGGCTDDHTGLSEGWKFAGWSWEQDCFCEGRGKPIGWLPFEPVPHGVPPIHAPTDTDLQKLWAQVFNNAPDIHDGYAMRLAFARLVLSTYGVPVPPTSVPDGEQP